MKRHPLSGAPRDGAPSRREFLQTLGVAAGLAPLLASSLGPGNHALGLQLYTVRDAAKADLARTLDALAAIGYREVEFAGLHGHSASAVRQMLDHAGLKAPGCHVSLEDLEQRFDQVAADARTLGQRYVIVPSLDEQWRSVAGYVAVATAFNRLGRALRKQGLHLGFHNHQVEFAALPGGNTGYDLLLQHTEQDLVAFELDLFWARDGGADSLDLFRRYRNRFRLVHIKDRAADGSQTTVGRGIMDWATLLAAAKRAGVRHWFIEQDDPPDPMGFAKESWEHMRTVKW